MSVKAAFFGGPWADQVHPANGRLMRYLVPLPVERTISQMWADEADVTRAPHIETFAYEWRGQVLPSGALAYYPERT